MGAMAEDETVRLWVGCEDEASNALLRCLARRAAEKRQLHPVEHIVPCRWLRLRPPTAAEKESLAALPARDELEVVPRCR